MRKLKPSGTDYLAQGPTEPRDWPAVPSTRDTALGHSGQLWAACCQGIFNTVIHGLWGGGDQSKVGRGTVKASRASRPEQVSHSGTFDILD